MKISLQNIGRISNAEVKIDGITVIAGQNNTGKSTVGKALYSVFNGFYKYTDAIKYERALTILNLITDNVPSYSGTLYLPLRLEILNSIDNYELIKNITLNFIDKTFNDLKHTIDIDKILSKIRERLEVSDAIILNGLIYRQFNFVFKESINNIFSLDKGIIELNIKNTSITLEFNKNKISNLKNISNLTTDAIFIDNPLVIDELDFPVSKSNLTQNRDLFNLLTSNAKIDLIDELLIKQKLINITEKINNVTDYVLIKSEYDTFNVSIGDTNKTIPPSSVSTGIKTFLILKTLLSNGSIKENGTIILDEPEVHLHPEWQLAFAEIIVLLHKEFNLHVLLTTHSPYFLNAIETYSKVHDIENKCNYYLARNEGNVSFIDDVTNDTSQIYKLLHKPFQTLLDLEYANEWVKKWNI